MSTHLALRAGWRHLLHRPMQLGLALLGVALGVAVVAAVNLATASANRAFDLSLEALVGQTTHRLTAGPLGIPEALYARLRMAYGLRRCAPVVEAYGQAAEETLHLFGIDPLAEGRLRTFMHGLPGKALSTLLTEPATGLLAAPTAHRLGIESGATLNVRIGAHPREIRIVGLIEPADRREELALDGLLLVDISTAQELLDRVGRLDRIDLVLAPGPEPVARLREWLPPGVQLLEAGTRRQALVQMTRAFEINLQAMGLLALVVGGFLIYNTVAFTVMQRRELFATLRVLGLTRAEVFLQVGAEALVLGLLGSLLGLGLGIVLAGALLQLVTRTINDLYFVLQVTHLSLPPGDLLTALALGTGSALAAALGPAWDAARTRPRLSQNRSLLEARTHALTPWLALGGAIVGAAAWLALQAEGTLLTGLAALFLIIVGYSLGTPLGVVILIRALARPLGSLARLPGRLAARGVDAALSRTGVAITALAVAVSATVGIGTMVDSFRTTVERWLHQTLQADIYISVPHQAAGGPRGALPAAVVARVRALDGIRALSAGQRITVDTVQGPVEILALSAGPGRHRGLSFQSGDAPQAYDAFEAGRGILLTEPLAFRRGLQVGDRLELPTATGRRPFQVLGIVYDYGSDQGMVLMDRDLYQRHWRDAAISSLGVYLEPGAAPSSMLDRLRSRLAGLGPLDIRSNGEIRRLSLEVFDRTFAITRVLRLLLVGVAFVGILGALLTLQLERAREYAVLRAIGLTPAQVWGVVGLQTTVMGLCAAILALPLGLIMSHALIHVINRRAFGWSMEMVLSGQSLAAALMLSLGAALLAGVYPAWRLSRVSPAQALREE